MGLFRSILGGGDKSPPARTVESPKNLQPGDMLENGIF